MEEDTEWEFDVIELSKRTILKLQDIIRMFRDSSSSSSSNNTTINNMIPFEQPNLIQNANYLLALKEARRANVALSPIRKTSLNKTAFVTPAIPAASSFNIPVVNPKRRKRKSPPKSTKMTTTTKKQKKKKTETTMTSTKRKRGRPRKKTIDAVENPDAPQPVELEEDGWQCPICKKISRVRSEAVVHIRTHTGEKPYVCKYPDCTKRYVYLSNLQAHELTHENKFKYSCAYCERGFNNKSMWQVHTRSHTGEKPFPCEFCDLRFSDRSNRRRHIRRKHKKEASAFGDDSSISTSSSAFASTHSAPSNTTTASTSTKKITLD